MLLTALCTLGGSGSWKTRISELHPELQEMDSSSQESGNLDNQVQQLKDEPLRKDARLMLEKEKNKQLWALITDNKITICQLCRELDPKNIELDSTAKVEYQDQIEMSDDCNQEGKT